MKKKDSPIRSGARTVAWPLRRFFGPQFQWVRDQVVESDHRIQARIDGVDARIEQLGSVVADRSESGAEALAQAGQELRVTADWLEAVRDEMAGVRTDLGGLHTELQGLRTGALHDAIRDRALRSLVGGSVDDLDAVAADLLNYAEGYRGFRAQRGLWFNDAVSVTHRAGDVVAARVSERIVEVPYVYRALGGVAPGARLLDVGGAESAVALSLASLGYEVTTIDLRRYPIEHPGLRIVESPLEEWDAEAGSFDAAICLSSIEHFGVGAYGEPTGAEDADRRAIEMLARLVKPGGLLVLTAPFGAAEVNDVERVYDREALDRLLDGWSVTDLTIARRAGDLVWVPTEPGDSDAVGEDGVAMVTARAPEA